MYVTCILYVFYLYFIFGVTPVLHRYWTDDKKGAELDKNYEINSKNLLVRWLQVELVMALLGVKPSLMAYLKNAFEIPRPSEHIV
jgi:hypothetical protein